MIVLVNLRSLDHSLKYSQNIYASVRFRPAPSSFLLHSRMQGIPVPISPC